jgi:hypothetical protein
MIAKIIKYDTFAPSNSVIESLIGKSNGNINTEEHKILPYRSTVLYPITKEQKNIVAYNMPISTR